MDDKKIHDKEKRAKKATIQAAKVARKQYISEKKAMSYKFMQEA